ncbi:response regulator [Phocaeicola paurosaccharolyticus]|uniref:hybrid sensor histidine kinase/response regulator transcription factor n=1 Tax=Phocaeicola paurosaccharolyticus TaxID=732242 RepID=UPI0038CD467F
MKTYIRYILIIILPLLSLSLYAEVKNYMFDIRYLGYSEGLSNERVFSIVQDENDAVWIATKIGIDRYNGTSVKSYELQGSQNYGDMAGRRVYVLYDKRFGIWAYDNVGRIFNYSKENDSFVPVENLGESLRDVILNNVHVDDHGTFWLGLNKGLYKRSKKGEITPVIKDIYVNDIISDGNTIYVGSSTAIIKVEGDGRKISTIHQGVDVQSIFLDKKRNELWIGTFNSGIFTLDMKTKEMYQLNSSEGDTQKPVRALTEYDGNTIIAGIDGGGLFTINKGERKIELLMNTQEKRSNSYLRGNGIYAVMKDHQDNLWIGSYTGGISIAIRLRYPISTLAHEKGNINSLANNNVNDIQQMDNGSVWYATDSGISICNSATERWKHILNGSVVITICKAGNEVWVGTYGDGVYLLDREGNIKSHLTKQNNRLATNYIFSIREDMQHDIWLGGLDGELIMLEKRSMKMHRYDINWVQSIEIVSKDKIAVATVNGFFIIDKVTGKIKQYSTSQEYNRLNASAYIVSMLFNSDGTVWLGTEGGGINLYDMKKGNVKVITTKEGLPSNDIYSLQRDYKGRLWASTGKGLALIENNKVSSLNYIGEIDKEYNKSSFSLLSDGKFAYGSTNGVIMISPDAITPTDYKAPLNFTDITIEYLDDDEQQIIKPEVREMLNDGNIQLSYGENSFEITFESINYRYQRDIQYQYILEGYEKSWSEPSSNGFVKYTNITPGTYKLKVRSIRRSDGHIISEKSVMIEVSQPWWNSIWAWVAYICIFASIVYIFLRFKNNQMQKQYDEDKIRFFINTAHDIRTPVTLIMSPLEDLCKETTLSDNVMYLLKLAHNNTRKLHELITKLLEFERVDTFRQHLKLNSISLNDLLAEEIAGFQALCDKKQLHLSLSLPDDEVYIVSDRSMLSMLLDNLISNASKYTMANGSVRVSLSFNNRRATISVEDTGIGIPKREQKKIFNGVFRAENAGNSKEIGTGFGLLQVKRIVRLLHGEIKFESEENRGSKFTITFRRTDEQPDAEDEITTVRCEREEETPELNSEKSIYHADTDTLLIVEDNDALRYYLRKTFENEYNVVDAADGEEAIAYLENNYPDIIVSDVMMPGIQGDKLCRMVKENQQTAGIPFVLLTAKSNHEAVVEGLKMGADDYIAKPFSSEILKLKIRTLIENRNRMRSYYMKSVLGQIEGTKAGESGDGEESQYDEEVEFNESELSQGDHDFLMNATDLVIKNIADTEFSINQLCMEMAMSRTLFYGRLKSLTGKAPQEFIRIIRLQRAADLLRQGKPVQEVAEETGFINTKYFSSLFKKQYGVQPSKYLKE